MKITQQQADVLDKIRASKSKTVKYSDERWLATCHITKDLHNTINPSKVKALIAKGILVKGNKPDIDSRATPYWIDETVPIEIMKPKKRAVRVLSLPMVYLVEPEGITPLDVIGEGDVYFKVRRTDGSWAPQVKKRLVTSPLGEYATSEEDAIALRITLCARRVEMTREKLRKLERYLDEAREAIR